MEVRLSKVRAADVRVLETRLVHVRFTEVRMTKIRKRKYIKAVAHWELGLGRDQLHARMREGLTEIQEDTKKIKQERQRRAAVG